LFKRHSPNPILSPSDIQINHSELVDVSSVFNPGGIKINGTTHLLLRVQNRGRETIILHATSNDGIQFDISPEPVVFTGLGQVDETIFHIYDPRITLVDNDIFIVTAVDVVGKCLLALFKTSNFKELNFLGFTGEDDIRNGVLFPEKINGKYAMFNRPNKNSVDSGTTTGSEIWYSESGDLKQWSQKEKIMEGRLHFWDEYIGAGPPPIKTKQGWLLVYHGIAMHYQPIYQAGVVLLDLEQPWKIKSRGRYNILEPRELWETVGQVPNVVFPTALIVDKFDKDGFAEKDSSINLYYGAADTHIGLATSTIQELIHACMV